MFLPAGVCWNMGMTLSKPTFGAEKATRERRTPPPSGFEEALSLPVVSLDPPQPATTSATRASRRPKPRVRACMV
jgi:hypothetical protein